MPLPGWPDRRERRSLLRLWLRRQRQPDPPRMLPADWRHQPRLAFWWTLTQCIQEQPLLMIAALAAPPAWAILLLLRCLGI